MQKVQVRLGSRSYEILISSNLLDDLGERAREVLGDTARRAIVVSNRIIGSKLGERPYESLEQARFEVHRFSIGDGERFKSLKSAESLLTFLIERRIERSDVIVALGGGVVGDLAG